MERIERQHVQVYRYCVTLACGDESVARAATLEAVSAAPDGPPAMFALARAAVKASLRQHPAAVPVDPADPAAVLYAARPALEEPHWSLLALVLPEYADRPRHRQVDLTAVAAALGRKADVTRKAVDRLVEPGGLLDLAMFTTDAFTGDPFTGGPGCPQLAAVVRDAKRLRPALRKAVAAHLPGCAACAAARDGRPAVLAVLGAVPLPAVPADIAALDTAQPAEPADIAALDTARPAEPREDTAAAPHAAGPGEDAATGDIAAAALGPAAPHDTGATDDDAVLDDLAAAGAAAGSVVPQPDGGADVTVELPPVVVVEPDRPLATVHHPLPAVPSARLPLLRRPPVLLGILVVLLVAAAGAGFLGVRGAPPKGVAGAAAVPSATVVPRAAPPAVVSAPAVPVSGPVPGSAGGGRTAAASATAKASGNPSGPAASGSARVLAPLGPAGDRLREVLPLLVRAPGCPGQTFGGACYSLQPFTLPLSVAVPAGFDEARLADALQWTVRAQTLLGPVEFRGRGNHARVTVTDGGQATPPTVWTMQAALTVGGETHLSNEVTLRVYATTG